MIYIYSSDQPTDVKFFYIYGSTSLLTLQVEVRSKSSLIAHPSSAQSYTMPDGSNDDIAQLSRMLDNLLKVSSAAGEDEARTVMAILRQINPLVETLVHKNRTLDIDKVRAV